MSKDPWGYRKGFHFRELCRMLFWFVVAVVVYEVLSAIFGS